MLAAGTATAVVGSLAGPMGTASAAGLAAPTALAPNNSGQNAADEATLQKDPILSWSRVAGATRYQVQLSYSSDWTDSTSRVKLPDNGVTKTTRLALPQALQHGDYFWRVRGANASTEGSWSRAAQLYRGWDAAPASPTANGWRLSWAPVPDASSYEVEMSASPTFSQPAQSGKATVDCLTTHTTWTPYTSVQGEDSNVDDCTFGFADVSDANGVSYWRVRAIDDSDAGAPGGASEQTLECFGLSHDADISGVDTSSALGTPASDGQECSDWSTTGQLQVPTFTAVPGAPPAVTAQLSCTSCTDMPEISWAPAAASSYRVTIATDANAQAIQRVYETPFTTLTPRDQLPDYSAGNGYWVFVQACTDDGCGTAAKMSFKKVTPAVDGLTSSTAPGATVLQWNDLLGRYSTSAVGAAAVEAKNYIVQVTHGADSDFAHPVFSTTLDRACDAAHASSCYQPPANTAAGKAQAVVSGIADGTYLWRVVPVDLSGNHLPAATATVAINSAGPVFRISNKRGFGVSRNVHVVSNHADLVGKVSQSTLNVVGVASGRAVRGSWTQTSDRRWTFNPKGALVTGERYVLRVVGALADVQGNPATVSGPAVRTKTRADDKSKGWSFGRGWTRHGASNALGGTFTSARSGHHASVSVAGNTVSVYGCKSPSFGKVTVQVDGHTKATVSEHLGFTKCGVLLWRGAVSSTAAHTIRLVTSGTGAIDQVRVS